MIQAVRSPSSERHSPWTRIILLTPPPIQVDRWAEHLAERDPPKEMDRTWENTKAYADAVKQVAEAQKVPVVDAWSAIWTAAGEELAGLTRFLSDGLHLTKEGYEVSTVIGQTLFDRVQIVYNELIQVIGKEYPELHYDKLPQILPA